MLISRLLKIKIFLLVFIGAACIVCFNVLGSYFYLNGPLKEDTIVIIENGLSIHNISNKLADEGVVKNPILFEVIATIYSYKSYLKSGEYKFTSGITPQQVLKELSYGRSVIHKFFVPEGLMATEIIKLINEEGRLEGRIDSNILEGYLLPSTYHYSYGDKREKIIDMMRKEMSVAIDEAMAILNKDSPLKTRKDVLIMASIIEKEAGNDDERPMVAGVFINRLNKGMKLQADPTVAYAITEGQNRLTRKLTKTDLRISSPYNTYHIHGLPKGPICCPGKKSIMAAVRPAKTKALYFVVDGNGGHVFSNTLKDHNHHVSNFRARVKAQEQGKK